MGLTVRCPRAQVVPRVVCVRSISVQGALGIYLTMPTGLEGPWGFFLIDAIGCKWPLGATFYMIHCAKRLVGPTRKHPRACATPSVSLVGVPRHMLCRYSMHDRILVLVIAVIGIYLSLGADNPPNAFSLA